MADPIFILTSTDPLGRDVVLAQTTYDYKRVAHGSASGTKEDIQECVEDPDYIYKSQWEHSPDHSLYYRINPETSSACDMQKVIVDHGYVPGRIVSFFKTDSIGKTGDIEHIRKRPRR